MPLVKIFNGDLKEYDGDHTTIIQKISEEFEIEPHLIKLIKNEENEEDEDMYFLLVQESKDYPFTCWENFFVPFTQTMLGDVDAKMFPKYNEIYNLHGFSIDISIMNELLKHHSAQEGLHGLIKSCVEGSRYSYEITQHADFKQMINNMIEKGAEFTKEIIDLIMCTTYDDPKYFEDEMRSIMAKGHLLRTLYEFDRVKELVSEYTNWDSVEPVYWEDLMDDTFEHLSNRFDYKTAYYMALKKEFTFGDDEDDEDE